MAGAETSVLFLLVVLPSQVEAEPRSSVSCDQVAFGRALRSEFLIADEYINLNHGSFGAVSRTVLAAQQAYVAQQEARPDVWFRETIYDLMNRTRAAAARLIGADAEDVVLVENASSAVNAVLRSMALQAGDVIVHLSTAYGMVKNLVAWLADDVGVEVVEIPLRFPMLGMHESVVEPVRTHLKDLASASPEVLARVKAVVFSHIVSNPGVILPVRELAGAFREAVPAARLVVDGAHALGQVPVAVADLGDVDFYLANGHKWLFSPKGSCVLWTARRNQSPTFPEPTVVSSVNIRGTPYWQRFAYTGTRDYTPLFAISDAIAFRRDTLGGEACVRGYVTALARKASALLRSMWATEALAPPEMEAAMLNIGLPTSNVTAAQAVSDHLLRAHGIYMLALREPSSGLVYTRLSAAVYLELADFERAGRLVLDALRRIEAVPS